MMRLLIFAVLWSICCSMQGATIEELEARVADLEARLAAAPIPNTTVIKRSEPINTAFLRAPGYNAISCLQVPLATSFDSSAPLEYDNIMYQFRGPDGNYNHRNVYEFYLQASRHAAWDVKLPPVHDTNGNVIAATTYEKFWRLGDWKTRSNGSRYLHYRNAFRLLPGASQINYVSVGPWNEETGLRHGIEWSGGGRMLIGRWFTFYENHSGAPKMFLGDRLVETDAQGNKRWVVHHGGKKYAVTLTELHD